VQTKIKIFQVLSEALLPILGYFYWSWSFYDLLLFYFLDLIVASVFTFVKIKKKGMVQQQKSSFTGFISILLLCYVTITILALLLIPTILPTFDVVKDTSRFLLLEDMGLPQGVFLLPLVFYAGYLQYKMKFLQSNLAQRITVLQVKKQHLQGLLAIIAILGLSVGLVQVISISELIAVFSLILLTAIYSFFWRE
jgi:hypothetical protein